MKKRQSLLLPLVLLLGGREGVSPAHAAGQAADASWAKLRQLEREYYVSIRGAGTMPVPHQPFIGVPTLNPANPLALPPGQTNSIEFRIGEDFAAARPAPRLSLRLRFNLAAAAAGAVATLNGKALSEGRTSGDWLEFEPGAETFRPGNNQLLLLTTAEKAQLLDLCVRASPGAQ